MKQRHIFCLLVAIAFGVGVGLAKNQEIAANDLGITSINCAAEHCDNKDSLDLWLQLQFICHLKKSSSFSLTDNSNIEIAVVKSRQFNSFVIGLICSLVSITGLIVGYFIGCRFFPNNSQRSNIYNSIPSTDELDYMPNYKTSFRTTKW
jgi:hypothetical protein